MFPSVALIFFLLHLQSQSIHSWGYSGKVADTRQTNQLSGSMVAAAVQVTANLVHQLDYIHVNHVTTSPSAPAHTTQSVIVSHEPQGVVILYFTPYSAQFLASGETKDVDDSSSRSAKSTSAKLATLMIALNSEAKRSGMEAYLGFTPVLVEKLRKTSSMSAPLQLSAILSQVDMTTLKEASRKIVNDTISALDNNTSTFFKDIQLLTSLTYDITYKA